MFQLTIPESAVLKPSRLIWSSQYCFKPKQKKNHFRGRRKTHKLRKMSEPPKKREWKRRTQGAEVQKASPNKKDWSEEKNLQLKNHKENSMTIFSPGRWRRETRGMRPRVSLKGFTWRKEARKNTAAGRKTQDGRMLNVLKALSKIPRTQTVGRGTSKNLRSIEKKERP